MSDAEDLDALIRRVDPDRWLASRFVADASARADLVALYAFHHELARAVEVASQPLVAEIRLAWWREALDELFDGRPLRRHPVAEALAEAVRRRPLARGVLENLIDARLRDLAGWPLEPAEVEPYIDATAGALMATAARILDPESDPNAFRSAARAWGLAGLRRVGGRLPRDWSAGELNGRIRRALRQANTELRGLPVAAFPGAAYACLSRDYASKAEMSELGKRLRLTWAVARGRV